MLIEAALITAIVTYLLCVWQAFWAESAENLLICYAGSVICPMLGLVSVTALVAQGTIPADPARYGVAAWIALGWLPIVAGYQFGFRRRAAKD